VHVQLLAPTSRMDILTESEIDEVLAKSKISKKYAELIDTESAYEILTAKLEAASEEAPTEEGEEKSIFSSETVGKVLNHPIARQAGRTAASIITRSLLGALGLGGKKTKGWF
jgi:uncharacterized protein